MYPDVARPDSAFAGLQRSMELPLKKEEHIWRGTNAMPLPCLVARDAYARSRQKTRSRCKLVRHCRLRLNRLPFILSSPTTTSEQEEAVKLQLQ